MNSNPYHFCPKRIDENLEHFTTNLKTTETSCLAVFWSAIMAGLEKRRTVYIATGRTHEQEVRRENIPTPSPYCSLTQFARDSEKKKSTKTAHQWTALHYCTTFRRHSRCHGWFMVRPWVTSCRITTAIREGTGHMFCRFHKRGLLSSPLWNLQNLGPIPP